MEKKQTRVSLELSAELCKKLLEPFDSIAVTALPTILQAFTMATMIISAKLKEETKGGKPDAVEKLVLQWITSVESAGEMNFSKYINLNEEEKIL